MTILNGATYVGNMQRVNIPTNCSVKKKLR